MGHLSTKALGGAGMMAALTLGSFPALAEPLSTYVAECKTELNLTSIPGYSCSDGVSIPSNVGFYMPTLNNYLGKVDTGNPNIDAIFLCRTVDSGTDTAELNGYILQDRVTGKTCFFDARPGARASNLPGPDSSSASTYWEDPAGMAGPCQNCHINDPYIVSPGLAAAFQQLGLLYGSRATESDYQIVSTDDPTSHFYEWEDDAKAKWLSPSCATGCHRMATDLIERIGNDLQADGLMPPQPNSLYAEVVPPGLEASLIIGAVW